MSDRCYMWICCRPQDAEAFEDVGFCVLERIGNVVHMEDPESNYAHCDDAPDHVPWWGYSLKGNDYEPSEYACDGVESLEVNTANDDSRYLISWDNELERPSSSSIEMIRNFRSLLKRVKDMLGVDSSDIRPKEQHDGEEVL